MLQALTSMIEVPPRPPLSKRTMKTLLRRIVYFSFVVVACAETARSQEPTLTPELLWLAQQAASSPETLQLLASSPHHHHHHHAPPVLEFDSQRKPLAADAIEMAMEALDTAQNDNCPPSLGTAKLPYALFELDSAMPRNRASFRFSAADDLRHPERAEYFWPGPNQGPIQTQTSTDFEEYLFTYESVIGKSSAFIEMPFRCVDLANGFTTCGPSDLTMGVKSVVFEGANLFNLPTANPDDYFRISTVMRSSFMLSPVLPKRGLSAGHFTLEPGVLLHYEYSDYLHFHGETKLMIPLGGSPGFAGHVWRYGVGASRVLYSTPLDTLDYTPSALTATLEVIGWEFLSGQEFAGANTISSNGVSVINLQPGLRYAAGEHFETGVNWSAAMTGSRLYSSRLQLDFAWTW